MTESVEDLVARLVAADDLTGVTLSKPRHRDPGHATRVTIDPVAGGYRWRHHHATRTIDESLTAGETVERLGHLVGGAYRQALLRSSADDFQVLAGGSATTVLRRPPTRPELRREHDRRRRHLLPEGEPVPFLVELGVMTADGKVKSQRRDKFRQVNRFLELVDDVLPSLPEGPLRVVDFGSGKSALTFALHHLLATVHGRDVELVGLDLKADVVAGCQELARSLGASGLRFEVGDISSWSGEGADLVVSLHACDTATDAALDRAVRLGAQVILAVPCCQHELLGQLESERLRPLLRHGILRERLAAEVTDAARAQLLALAGYDVQVVEFVDLEHTPKNLLIRARRLARKRPERDRAALAASYRAFADELGIQPALERLLADLVERP